MTIRATAVNRDVLKWARERAGLSHADVGHSLGRPADTVAAWEAGEETPTFRQLEALAHRVYKRPLALFFFPAAPTEPEITSEFRTIPSAELQRFTADTLYALREAKAWQLSLPDLLTGIPRAREPITAVIRPSVAESMEAMAARVRAELGVPLSAQQEWHSAEEALKGWRQAVESVGVYVFKRAFKQADISGFCLHDDNYPLIILNNSTAHVRQIFTLFHELAHLLYHVSSVTTRHAISFQSVSEDARAIEIACNRFASEFLVPIEAFPWSLFDNIDIDAGIQLTAKRFNVSRVVVLRRLLDAGRIDSAEYERRVEEWADDYFRSGTGEGGGSYYANIGTYISGAYLRAAFHQYHAGALTIGDLADRLGVRAQNIGRLEEFVLGGGDR